MMRTVYVSMLRRGAELHGIPQPTGPRTVAHIDPLCTQLRTVADAAVMAVPADIQGRTARLLRNGQTRPVALCKSCHHHNAVPVENQLWRDDAMCAPSNRPEGYEDVSWFPVPGISSIDGRRNARAAREVCLLCPVSDDCYRYAIESAQRFGMWAGVGESGRFVLIAKARRGEAV